MEIVCILRARLGTEPLVLLTPNEVELQRRTRQHLAEERVLILPFFDAVDPIASNPFVLRSVALTRVIPSARSAGRLQIDLAGHSAALDGEEVALNRMEFEVFRALAEEAGQKNGYVPKEDLLQVIDAFRDDPESPASPENLDNILSGIRRALASEAGIPTSDMKLLVETRRNLGHRLGLNGLGLEPSDVAIF
jgi:DNA-binding response OmpR family regulator